nr:hypothetical protein CFP56_57956 [Quercus suber]
MERPGNTARVDQLHFYQVFERLVYTVQEVHISTAASAEHSKFCSSLRRLPRSSLSPKIIRIPDHNDGDGKGTWFSWLRWLNGAIRDIKHRIALGIRAKDKTELDHETNPHKSSWEACL